MLDNIMFGGQSSINIGELQNESPRITAVARNNVGLVVGSKDIINGELGGDFSGRVSLGILGMAVAGLVLFYLWTHNVQGGG